MPKYIRVPQNVCEMDFSVGGAFFRQLELKTEHKYLSCSRRRVDLTITIENVIILF